MRAPIRPPSPASRVKALRNIVANASGTADALKEHFILERIAEEEDLDVEDGDYDREIFLMSMQSGEQ